MSKVQQNIKLQTLKMQSFQDLQFHCQELAAGQFHIFVCDVNISLVKLLVSQQLEQSPIKNSFKIKEMKIM